jgi:hypothetical protein
MIYFLPFPLDELDPDPDPWPLPQMDWAVPYLDWPIVDEAWPILDFAYWQPGIDESQWDMSSLSDNWIIDDAPAWDLPTLTEGWPEIVWDEASTKQPSALPDLDDLDDLWDYAFD